MGLGTLLPALFAKLLDKRMYMPLVQVENFDQPGVKTTYLRPYELSSSDTKRNNNFE